MFDQLFIRRAINRSAVSAVDRRRFLRTAGLAGAGAVGMSVLGGSAAQAADSGAATDATVLNFALNLEYLEAEFYARAVTGQGLPGSLLDGRGTRGKVTGGRKVNFETPAIEQYAREIANDERLHVSFLRGALGSAAVAEPDIDIDAAFTAAAKAAGLGDGFDAYANETNFLLAAFIFEDVGVTAYKGAAPLITNKTFLEAAAGILAVEAYHAANIRTTLAARGVETPDAKIFQTVESISGARDSLDGRSDLDQGIGTANRINITPTDANAIVFSRTPGQVLNIVYLTPQAATEGGFFPSGVNGSLNASSGAPSGGVGAGGGSTAGGENNALIGGGSAALLAAGGAAVYAASRRPAPAPAAAPAEEARQP